jgi:hypothetical protein
MESENIKIQNRTHVYMNLYDHKDLGNHLLQLCPKVMQHSVCYSKYITEYSIMFILIILHTFT